MRNINLKLFDEIQHIDYLLSEYSLKKNAGVTSDIANSIKNYVGNYINPEDKAGSVINLLAPGAIFALLRTLGFGKLSLIIPLLMNVFHVDINNILSSIYQEITNNLSEDKKFTSTQIDSIVHNAVQEHYSPDENKVSQNFNKEIRILKLSLIHYENIIKSAKPQSFWDMWPAASRPKAPSPNLVASLLSLIFRIILASAGFMVAGDVINKFLGRPNALDNTIQKGKPVSNTPEPSTPSVTQTKFKINPSYRQENHAGSNWVENVKNEPVSIENMLVQFAKDVYSGLDGMDSIIKSTPGFQVVKDRIVSQNRYAAGDPIVFIPPYLTSKKQIVDLFIDDVANKS